MATTTNYSWTTPNDSDPFRNGASAIRTLGSAVDTTLYTALGGAYPGLRLIKTQAVGTAVSSVSVTGAFSATYDEYKIIYSKGVSSLSSQILYMGLGALSTNYYSSFVFQNATSAAQTTYNITNGSLFFAGIIGTANSKFEIDISNPFASSSTMMNARFGNLDSVTSNGGTGWGVQTSATSVTSFTLSPATGTITGGTIYVYGYGKS